MMGNKITLIFFVSCVIHLAYFDNHRVREKVDFVMEKYKIVPNVIPVAPKKPIKIAYPNGAHVLVGRVMTPLEAHEMPTCHWENNNKTFYTFAIFNPEFNGSDVKIYEWVNWLTVNIPGDDVYSGELIVDYIGPLPPNDHRFHMYVFLVYAQRDKVEWDEQHIDQWSVKNRENFDMSSFTKKYYLGDPVAGNFFYSRYDKSVPRLIRVLRSEVEDYYDFTSATAPSLPPEVLT